jgi:MoxR-like ATPase
VTAFQSSEARISGDDHLVRALNDTIEGASEIVLGKEHAIRLALASMAARGHLLIEDVPGVGKTLLAQALARLLGLDFQRVQFTSDLLPADILGASVYERQSGTFRFHPGPIFSQLVLADEVNRATPKTQSALLEAMEEYQVTQDGETRPLPAPFFVIATQNPVRQVGTFPLPESQLDRFLMRIDIGYPDADAERALFKGRDRREHLNDLAPCLGPEDLTRAQIVASEVHVSDALVAYVQAIVSYTRNAPHYELGLSPRAGIALVRASQAWAFMDGRAHVVPEDVQAVLPGVVSHRLSPVVDSPPAGDNVAEQIVQEVDVP